jgi:3-hydroxyisobutyrate dehydrogenase-like beta-hydroxyacid dehydrogenase
VASDRAELVGVWGRNPAKAEALARRFGVGGYEDLDALLGAVDAVAVAVPPDVQAELAVRAARADGTCCSTSRWRSRWSRPGPWWRRPRRAAWHR